MQEEQRRPAGVDPSVLRVGTSEPDRLMAEAQAIGRRVALKLFPSGAAADPGTGNRCRWDAIADVVEAEVRSVLGTPKEGEIIVRLSYPETVQIAAALGEAQSPQRTGSETEILSDLRGRFLAAAGVSID